MARSRKGKLASKRLAIKSITEKFEKRFVDVSYKERRVVYEKMLSWCNENFEGEQLDMVLTALDNVPCVKDIKVEIGVEKALKEIKF